MKKSARVYTERSRSGFTLVELLVVISIIAILSTVGVVVFTRVSQTARDGKRVADIDSIAKSLETSKDYTTGFYYNKLGIDFPNEIPTDPKGVTNYCICTHITRDERPNPPTSWSSGCPSNWVLTTCAPNYDSLVVSGTLFHDASGEVGVKSWKVCAKKEGSGQVYCKGSLER